MTPLKIFRVLSSCRSLPTAWPARSGPALLAQGTRCITPLQFPEDNDNSECLCLYSNMCKGVTPQHYTHCQTTCFYLFKSVARDSLKGLLHIDCLLGAGFKIWDVVLALTPSLCPLGCYLNRKRADVNNGNVRQMATTQHL